jgi:UDP-hydrolysing UDP-N-acetyl-D-glucosamine 2-epimerase
MNQPRRICVVTGTRAEYGLLKGLLRKLQADPAIELQLVVTAAHLQDAFGRTVGEIEADGMPIAARVELPLDGGAPVGAAKALGQGVGGMAEALHGLAPDLVVVLGDRIELLAVASCCLILGIPLAHIHGGEITEGAIDDAVRHAVTKMAQLHFPAAEAYRDRILQMGEMPERVIVSGAPGLDNIAAADFLPPEQLARDFRLALDQPVLAVTCHPETASSAPDAPARAMLDALDAYPQATIVFTAANADPGGEAINQMIDVWVAGRPNAAVFASLGMQRYLSLLKIAAAVIGNSSSGLIEAPALGVPTVNIGDRQKGRLRARSVIDCASDADAVGRAIARALSPGFRAEAQNAEPPYGRPGAAAIIHRALADCDPSQLLQKRFVDRPGAPA